MNYDLKISFEYVKPVYFSFESARVEQKLVEVQEEIKRATVSVTEDGKQDYSPKKDNTVRIKI